jgi:hypothetical protein
MWNWEEAQKPTTLEGNHIPIVVNLVHLIGKDIRIHCMIIVITVCTSILPSTVISTRGFKRAAQPAPQWSVLRVLLLLSFDGAHFWEAPSDSSSVPSTYCIR